MPIRPYLDGHTFDSETIRLLGLAFEITRSALNVQEGDEQAKESIAKELIELPGKASATRTVFPRAR